MYIRLEKMLITLFFEHVEGFYNTNRRHSYLGYLTIKEFNEHRKFKQLKTA